MNEAPAFLAFDLGAESGRVLLGRLYKNPDSPKDGTSRLELQEIHRFPNGPIQMDGSLHWDVERLWAEMKHGLAMAVREAGDSLISLGVDTWGVDFGLLDESDHLLGNPYHYRDRRTEGMMKAACSILPRSEIYASTGIQFMPLNSLYQLLAMLKSGSPQLMEARTFLNMPDLFNLWFSGVKASEFTIATTTQCYDPNTNQWALGMLKKLGIPTAIFGKIVPPGTVLGGLLPEISNEAGAKALKVVAVASHDTQSAIAAVPATSNDYLYLSSGTWSLMGTEVVQAVINRASLDCDLTNEGGYGGKFCLLKNIVGLWILQECRRIWVEQGHNYSYEELTALASSAPSLQTFIDPADVRFLPPGDMPARIRAFCLETGQPVPDTDAEIVRCILESLAMEYCRVASQISDLLKRSLPVIHIIGGGSRNTLLNQFTANATGRTVIAGPVEATAIGNILVQAISAGQVSSLAEGRTIVSSSFESLLFEPRSVALWEAAYHRFLNLRTERLSS
jgi:rhamnulokinase